MVPSEGKVYGRIVGLYWRLSLKPCDRMFVVGFHCTVVYLVDEHVRWRLGGCCEPTRSCMWHRIGCPENSSLEKLHIASQTYEAIYWTGSYDCYHIRVTTSIMFHLKKVLVSLYSSSVVASSDGLPCFSPFVMTDSPVFPGSLSPLPRSATRGRVAQQRTNPTRRRDDFSGPTYNSTTVPVVVETRYHIARCDFQTLVCTRTRYVAVDLACHSEESRRVRHAHEREMPHLPLLLFFVCPLYVVQC